MHRALTDGSLAPDAGEFPLNHVILGGRHLYSGENYIVAFVSKEKARSVATALALMSADDMRRLYDAVVPRDYAPEYGADDREYTVEWWSAVVAFYALAASAGRAVIFTVDQ